MRELIEKILDYNTIPLDAKTENGQTTYEVLESYIEQALDIIEDTIIE